jgi:HlyD family secretion protein
MFKLNAKPTALMTWYREGIFLSKRQRTLIVFIVVAAVTAAAYWWYVAWQVEEPLNELVLYGNVDIREIRLAFNGSEHVAEIRVEEGDWVQPGQLLARLHTARLQAARDRVRAELVAAEAAAHGAELSYRRIKTLAASKLASSEQADEAEANSRTANAQVAAAQAALAEAEQALADADLYAPVGGMVRERIVEQGDFVTPQTPVITLALTDPVWVRSYLPESFLGQVRLGARALISTDSYPGKVYEGWVGFVSPTAEFTPKNVETPELRTRLVYQVRIFACNPQGELRLGMPATVTIPLGQDVTAAGSPDDRCAVQGPGGQ